MNPYAAANALAMKHLDIADKVARNISKRTGHPVEDLRQIAMTGIIQASRRYIPERGDFRKYARTYANGEVCHFLRDQGFLIKVPPSWREKHARGKRLLETGITLEAVLLLLRVSERRWQEIVLACAQKIVSLPIDD